ncbi:MAG: hypothetical protein RLZZ292_780 [Bacteroidota bacterium]|jgi:predicted ATP-dependent endonuclease of OLD family
MQKIIIKNFRQIEYAEIEIKKITLLIGEQASGKSTIAKLIYFFKSLKGDLAEATINAVFGNNVNIEQELLLLVEKRFKLFLNNDINFSNNTIITFQYSKIEWVTIEKKPLANKNLNIGLCLPFLDELNNEIIPQINSFITDMKNNYIPTKIKELEVNVDTNTVDLDITKLPIFANVKESIKERLEDSKNKQFFPAGRNISVSYPDQFQILFFSGLNSKRNEINYSTDIKLMKDFIEHSVFLKDFYKVRGGSLESVLEDSEYLDININNYIISLQEYILKGKYHQNGSGETIGNKSKKINIQLSNASSGQQEAIRILQDLTYIFWGDEEAFRVIEEPEAHLYPQTQAKLIQLIALAANLTKSTFILTTHSPYLLSIVNNLLYYNRVIERNPKAKKALDKHFGTQKLDTAKDERIYLSPDEVSVYAVDTICKSVIDPETGLIGENYLDQITDELNDDFDVILSHNIANHQIKK